MHFTVYKSSAGSGKTFTLVKEYVRIVLANPKKYRQILAITFTNKAANEMKQRILGSLKEIAQPLDYPDSPAVKIMLPEITESTGLNEEIISNNARQAISFILHNYTDFAVSTIDSFMHRVIRSFAFDLHIPMDFEVELDEGDLLKKMVDVLISMAGTEDKLTRFLVEFTMTKADNEKNWNIELDIYKIAKIILNEDSQFYLDKLKELSLDDFTGIIRFLQKWVMTFESKVRKTGEDILNLIASKGIDSNAFYRGQSGIVKYFEYMAYGRFDKWRPNSYVVTTIEEDKWISGKASAEDTAGIMEIKSEITASFKDLQQYFETNHAKYILYADLLNNIYPLAILNEIDKILSEYKQENSILLISEFNKRIADVVLSEPVPFIYERIGEKYRHFLIDEFQDTSVLQWQNLLPLIENALSVNNFTMVVGDGKQAIYRWRSGEVEQFAKLPEIYQRGDDPQQLQLEQALIRNYNLKVLTSNFRSREKIISFNNRFFRMITRYLDKSYASIYEDVAQNHANGKGGGYVQLVFFDKNEDEHTFEEFNFDKILEVINDAERRGFQRSDIAILCRSNRNASSIARILLEQGIPVVSAESLLLENSPEVKLVLSFIKLLINADDEVSKTEVIGWLSQQGKIPPLHTSLTNAGLFKYGGKGTENGSAFYSVLRTYGFNIDQTKLLSLPVYELCEQVIRIFGLHEDVDAYLQFLLDAVLDVSKDPSIDVFGLMEWWEKRKEKLSIVVPEGIDAVRIMTIHKAKGLEFPLVIYPFADDRVKKTKNVLWVDMNDENLNALPSALISTSKSMEDTIYAEQVQEEAGKSLLDLINILYVVQTRPTDELYIITRNPPANPGDTPSLPVIYGNFLSEEGVWENESGSYAFGQKLIKKSEKAKFSDRYSLDTWISRDWEDRIRISFQAPKHWNIEELDQKKKWGSLIHNILSNINSSADIQRVTLEYQRMGLIVEEERKNLNNEIEALLSEPMIGKYFREGLSIKNEPDIILSDGKIYRPDRVIFDGDTTTVIDFKTGAYNQSHDDQVKRYMDILKQMSYPNVKGVLIYLYEVEKIRHVS